VKLSLAEIEAFQLHESAGTGSIRHGFTVSWDRQGAWSLLLGGHGGASPDKEIFMILWSVSSIGKRVSFLGVMALLVWLQAATPAYGQAATAPAASTAPAKKTIQAAQERLLALGYQPGSADGVMGARAIAALKKFQSDRGLPVTTNSTGKP
jgi:hypothetical protein